MLSEGSSAAHHHASPGMLRGVDCSLGSIDNLLCVCVCLDSNTCTDYTLHLT